MCCFLTIFHFFAWSYLLLQYLAVSFYCQHVSFFLSFVITAKPEPFAIIPHQQCSFSCLNTYLFHIHTHTHTRNTPTILFPIAVIIWISADKKNKETLNWAKTLVAFRFHSSSYAIVTHES